MLRELSLKGRLDRSSRDVIELNVCITRRCRTFGTWIGWIAKTFDYINRVMETPPLSVYEGTWTHSPLSLLCITMILRVRRKFFEITTFPNTRGSTKWGHLPRRAAWAMCGREPAPGGLVRPPQGPKAARVWGGGAPT